jgi:hypothetical protein
MARALEAAPGYAGRSRSSDRQRAAMLRIQPEGDQSAARLRLARSKLEQGPVHLAASITVTPAARA